MCKRMLFLRSKDCYSYVQKIAILTFKKKAIPLYMGDKLADVIVPDIDDIVSSL